MTLAATALVLTLCWGISLPGGDFMVLLLAF
ncbi:putative protein OS=Tsukamurella paurometabola (strain ATCC 8368 / DSM / CCUG 35730 /CIP 100753 / JCM 10117 / KCTC 9821 / NBRC 16120 / NCIMB 702349/ NCTC 13040) OX=521096 GN=Tpau_0153 PE=4 SV=1 [Tsukamurella paurometabola]|uniref:Uncharacterized protein n=1 Tax=Tsukamurella paurometabola (strain ATCC 8368 / DSM 20162 / CCUG 35730 / CIP 100753 / JCM 10117 / KCTC 9821 / NBRC 16120 / NCIMB 702349 / NCTC 13040) TaxID=521096 RepID=D5UQ39_TSUPD|nr:hypothetical protein Tpau_0153 [Tsukamurella paurometabola DSM 20162]SUP41718.1 Uncharacterised protein [Tsukamurella paurometabola]